MYYKVEITDSMYDRDELEIRVDNRAKSYRKKLILSPDDLKSRFDMIFDKMKQEIKDAIEKDE